MCLISNCPKGTKKDSEEVLAFIRSGAESNGMGSGYMFKRNGEKLITVKKGFFDIEKLIESLLLDKLTEDDELSIHHRISTSGLVNDLNTHPFVVSRSHNEIIATDITIEKPCLVHNGIFKNIDKLEAQNPEFSDTYAFTRYIMSQKECLDTFKSDLKDFEIKLKDIVGWSKLTLLLPDMDMIMFGDFQLCNGYYHSNNGYKTKTYDRGGSSYGNGLSSYYGRGYEDDRFDYRSFNKNTPYIKPIGYNYANTDETRYDHFMEKKEYNISTKAITTKITHLDNNAVQLYEGNIKHFFYCLKVQYDDPTYNKAVKFWTCDSFDPISVFNVLSTKTLQTENDTTMIHKSVLTEDLINDYYYIPKNSSMIEVYKDYLRILTTPGDIGTKTIKKLENVIRTCSNRDNMDLIFYKKTGEFVKKLALVVYLHYLKSNKIVVKTTADQFPTFSD